MLGTKEALAHGRRVAPRGGAAAQRSPGRGRGPRPARAEPWLPIAIGAGLLALLSWRCWPSAGGSSRAGCTRAPAIVPLGKGLELEGESADPEIGRFSGTAYAVQIPDLRDPEKRAHDSRLYVLDPKRDLPFWVSYAEVHTPLPPDLQAHPRPWELQGSLRPGASVLGYVTVPTTYPERHAELFEQLESIEALCKRRRFRLVAVVRDEDPAAKATLERPGHRLRARAVREREGECTGRMRRRAARAGRRSRSISCSAGSRERAFPS